MKGVMLLDVTFVIWWCCSMLVIHATWASVLESTHHQHPTRHSLLSSRPSDQHNAPIIAIVVEPFAYNPPVCVSVWGTATNNSPSSAKRSTPANSDSSSLGGCVWSVYVDWLEASGIRVLPLPWDAPTSRMDYILDRVQGVLFPGGIIQGDDPVTDAYFRTVQYIFHRAVHQYNLVDGDRFVVWGTCQGFEMLNAAAAGTLKVVESSFIGTDPSMLPLKFLNDTTTTSNTTDRLFAGIVPELRYDLETRPITLNWHSKGVSPSAYTSAPYNETLGRLLQPITISNDTTGRWFVSSMQGVNDSVRVFATQFHPERPPFEFDNDVIAHDERTIQASQFLSLQLRKWLSESGHRFENATEADAHLINNYERVNQGWGVQVYFL